MTDAYKSEEPSVRKALEALKAIAEATKIALMRGRLTEFGELLTENWNNQKRLHPSVTNEQIEHLFKIAMANGATGGKACGAGGGGCLLFYCEPTREHRVRQKLEDAGARIIDVNFDFDRTSNVESLKRLNTKIWKIIHKLRKPQLIWKPPKR